MEVRRHPVSISTDRGFHGESWQTANAPVNRHTYSPDGDDDILSSRGAEGCYQCSPAGSSQARDFRYKIFEGFRAVTFPHQTILLPSISNLSLENIVRVGSQGYRCWNSLCMQCQNQITETSEIEPHLSHHSIQEENIAKRLSCFFFVDL